MKITANYQLNHDGVLHAVGEVVDMAEEHAIKLVDMGLAKLAEEEKAFFGLLGEVETSPGTPAPETPGPGEVKPSEAFQAEDGQPEAAQVEVNPESAKSGKGKKNGDQA